MSITANLLLSTAEDGKQKKKKDSNILKLILILGK